MALVSPGVEVSIIDQSQYLPAASSSVPLVVLATAQNKANAAGTGVAPATTAANANKLYQVTSQRDLVNLYGTPFFYKTTNGTPIQGYELNEYGLLAAYSLLGATNRCFVLRADIDLASLVGTLTRPVGDPDDGTYWLDTLSTSWGIYAFNAGTGKFANVTPVVITDPVLISGGAPVNGWGNIGSYAIIPDQVDGGSYSRGTYFFKCYDNTWAKLGSQQWKQSVPTVQGNSYAITTGSFSININGGAVTRTVTTTGLNVGALATAINNLKITYLFAREDANGKLIISYSAPGINNFITLANVSGTPLSSSGGIGIAAGTYYAPDVVWANSANMPLWSSSQATPHPTGSVWIKTSVSGNGMESAMSQYSSTVDSWIPKVVGKYTTPFAASADLDSSGGQAIPVGTIFATVGDNTGTVDPSLGISYYARMATGQTVITGAVNNPSITIGSTLTVSVSVPGSSVINNTNTYSFVTTGSSATDFTADWNGANIPNTQISINSAGALVITHTKGGDIYMSDFYQPGLDGQSNGLLTEIGFDETQANTQRGIIAVYPVTGAPTTSLNGSGATFDVMNVGTYYDVTLNFPGTGYGVGDIITIDGGLLAGASGTNDLQLSVQSIGAGGAITSFAYYSGYPRTNYVSLLSNWELIDYIPNEGAPATNPLNGTNWYYSTATEVDIMVQKNGDWIGYKNTGYDSNGHPSVIAPSGQTDPLGPITSTTAPTLQTDGTPLVYGDLWLDTSDLENYPKLSRWQNVDGLDEWVALDNTDQTSENGVLFADARWADSGNVDPVSDPLTSIVTLLTSDYLDLDAPNPDLYPQGMLLFNTRRSGYNVKQFRTNYFTAANYPSPAVLPTYSYTWVTASGLQSNGSAYMGRKAQRNMVVQAMKAAVTTNLSIREEDTFFNLMAAPGYPELQPDMVVLNNDRNNTAYIIGDTPMRLADQATDITNWATNAAGATSTGEDGWVTRDTYLGVFYPSGITTDLTGALVAVPASHMMLRTFLRNDTIAYPWLAPAGTRRGTIDNATNIGYIDSTTGEFITIKNRMGIRDVLYVNQINPLAFFTGVGLLNYGNKNSFDSQSALDRINVARLICYIRERLQVAARPFVFEPNDALTRSEIQGVVQSLFIDLVAKRGLYDYLVVCDESNNTPARIDRNELWIDVAIEPVKAAEFIYIPVRVLNTGEING